MKDWQRHEDHVATLYRALSFEVTSNISVDGQQVDLLCEKFIAVIGRAILYVLVEELIVDEISPCSWVAHSPNASTCSSVSKPSQCATSCQTTCFTSARKSPFEHRRMGPRKTKIKSGAKFSWANDRFVLNMPLYSPNNSVPWRHFSRSDISLKTSGGGSSST